MKIIIILSIFILVSCGSQDSSDIINCTEPENPYSAGGHHEGFKWAESKGFSNCNGNSSSFNEGCEEYGRQLDLYNQCSN